VENVIFAHSYADVINCIASHFEIWYLMPSEFKICALALHHQHGYFILKFVVKWPRQYWQCVTSANTQFSSHQTTQAILILAWILSPYVKVVWFVISVFGWVIDLCKLDLPVLSWYCDGFAQGIAEQRSRGTPAGWHNSPMEAFPSRRRMHVWRNAIQRMCSWRQTTVTIAQQ
jgi:hypothetical protein